MTAFLATAFRIVILAVFAAAIWYVAARLRAAFGLRRRWPVVTAVAVYVMASMTAMLGGSGSENALVGVLTVLGGYLFSFIVFLLLLLLFLHPIQVKSRLPLKGTTLTAMAAAFALTAAGALWANPFGVNEIEIPLEGLEQDVVVMHIPDVHVGHHRGMEYLAEIVAETNRRKPDLVLINGDLVDADAALLPGVLSPLSDFDAPVFFTGGNHDNYVDTKRLLKLITGHGVRVLHNEVVDTHGIQLVGLDYMNPDDDTFDMHPSRDKRTIKSELPNLELKNDRPTVLVHHSPVGSQYVSARGIDLMLSGHTHAGQMFPGTFFARFVFPFDKGLHRKGDTRVFVSQGAGTFGPRVRLGASNQIDLIRLKAGK